MQPPKAERSAQGAAEKAAGAHADAEIRDQGMEPSEGVHTVPEKPPLQEHELMEDAPPGDAPAEDAIPENEGIPMDGDPVASGSSVEQSSAPNEDERVQSDSSSLAADAPSGASTGIEEQLGNLVLEGAELHRYPPVAALV